ncbi:unnamed protein product [Lactuca saligna]|uniref:Uncharacterized protein n=1 Tax=Lactuca saligna TaxID=75948 RepID=A0AA35VXC1_LACSI|nr:unnamed protein product [Lactuca saligna]
MTNYLMFQMVMLTVYAFLYGRLYLCLSGLEKAIMKSPNMQGDKALKAAMASQSVVQLGLLMALPMIMEIGLERGFRTTLGDLIIMNLQLSTVFFTFSLGIGVLANKSLESWWEEEQDHLRATGTVGRLTEILLSLRFFIYQYSIVTMA